MNAESEPEQPPMVFVVDDDTSMLKALSSLVRSPAMRVDIHFSHRFLRRKRPGEPCCLVLDVGLPGLSGIELQRELGGGDRPVPIVFITAHGDISMSV